MANVLGRTWKLLWNATAIGQLTSVQLTLDSETIDVTNYDSNQWTQLLPNTKTWSIAIEGNYDETETEGYEQLLDDQLAGTVGTALLSTAVSSSMTLSGSAYITGLPLSGSTGEILKFTATVTGTGALTKGTVA